jgi:hypothetical protein
MAEREGRGGEEMKKVCKQHTGNCRCHCEMKAFGVVGSNYAGLKLTSSSLGYM